MALMIGYEDVTRRLWVDADERSARRNAPAGWDRMGVFGAPCGRRWDLIVVVCPAPEETIGVLWRTRVAPGGRLEWRWGDLRSLAQERFDRFVDKISKSGGGP